MVAPALLVWLLTKRHQTSTERVVTALKLGLTKEAGWHLWDPEHFRVWLEVQEVLLERRQRNAENARIIEALLR